MLGDFNKSKLIPWLIMGFFGVVYCSISLINHYYFRTFSLDLGLYNNAIYDYAHFRWNDYSLLDHLFANPLGDHFALLPILVSPLYWIFGSWTMLVVQIAGILFGGYGLYHFVAQRTESKWLPNLAMIHFFTLWGIYSALSFDFHDNVMAAMFVPWFLHYFDKQSWGKTIVFFILILISKENMALWAAFLGFGLMLQHYKNRAMLIKAGMFSIVALIYFVVVLKLVIPALSGAGDTYYHFKYAALGANFGEAIQTILTRPWYTLETMFTNHLGDPIADGIKPELFWMILLCGGLALVVKPQYIVMMLPIIGQKVYSDDFMKWGLNFQYSIEFVPLLSLAVFSFLIMIRVNWVQKGLALLVVVCTVYGTVTKLETRVSKWYVEENNQFFNAPHWNQNFDVNEMRRVFSMIPDNASLCAQSILVPHVAFRDVIYDFPRVEAAEYVLLVETDNTYPLNKDELKQQIDYFSGSGEWATEYSANRIHLFRRK